MIHHLYTYDPKKKQQVLVGKYDYPSATFIKEVKPKHYMIKEKGYGIQEETIQGLKELNCKNIIFISKTKRLEFPFELILEKPIKNYGHGEQRFLRVI